MRAAAAQFGAPVRNPQPIMGCLIQGFALTFVPLLFVRVTMATVGQASVGVSVAVLALGLIASVSVFFIGARIARS